MNQNNDPIKKESAETSTSAKTSEQVTNSAEKSTIYKSENKAKKYIGISTLLVLCICIILTGFVWGRPKALPTKNNENDSSELTQVPTSTVTTSSDSINSDASDDSNVDSSDNQNNSENSNDSNKIDDSKSVTDVTTTEPPVITTTNPDNTKPETADTKAPANQDNGNTNNDLSVKLVSENSWEQEELKFCNYSFSYENKSKKAISNWKIEITFSSSVTIVSSWEGKYQVSGNKIIVTPEDYNKNVEVKGEGGFGFIISSESKVEIKSIKV